MEPVPVANPFDIANFIGGWGLNYNAVNSHDIPVYANTILHPDGTISVSSLTVDNTNTRAHIAVAR